MDIKEFFDRIGLSAGGIDTYNAVGQQDTGFWRSLLFCNRAEFLRQIKEGEGYRRRALRIFLDIAYNNSVVFDERGISRDIYFDTCSDIAIWCENCFRQFGEYGLAELDWVVKSINLTLFRLGRLQFELMPIKELSADGRSFEDNDIVLNVHIPQGKPLEPNECLRSFDAALKFFRGINPAFVCQSWLLYPGLKELLPKESNIVRFGEMFEPIKTDYESKQAEERIFFVARQNYEEYPEDTALQRSAKAFLLKGGRLGETFGLLKFSVLN